jgi:8-oxo-dGTP diphosphatase
METHKHSAAIFQQGARLYHPGLSVDCVIFGFHNSQLRVLLLNMKSTNTWALPGGFVLKEEGVDAAATRVLEDRTGLKNIFLQQFHLFGDPARNDVSYNKTILQQEAEIPTENHWFLQRFVTLGYYALVNFQKAIPRPDAFSSDCSWWNLHELPPLALDHGQILAKALESMRLQLHYQPIGYQLLPPTFTMPELQALYETLLGRTLDRRNFQRKMLSFGILEKLPERKTGVAHKAPFLYRFQPEKYRQALEEGLKGGW